MVDRQRTRKRRTRRARWRAIALGGFVGAGAGFYVLLVRQLLIERATIAVPESTGAQQQNPKTAFESTDWELAPVALIYVVTLALLVISCLVLIGAYPNALPDVSRALRVNPPGPHLQTNPEADLQRFRLEETKRLNGYYWVDQQKGIVHIPIEQAMKKLAQTGIDGFPKAQQ